MKKFQREYIGLIQAAFTGTPIELSPDFDWEKAVNLSKKHNIAPIIFYGAVSCNISKENEYMRELYQLTLQSLKISLRQTHEIKQIESAFEKEGIDYMPLKGTILKTVYPKPEMRTMGDADVLIRLEQYSQIQEIMTSLGFEFQYESDHELVWKKPSLFLELHKSIMTTYNKDFYHHFGSGWKIANRLPNCCRHEMSAEDFYIFIFVHFTKHYRISGIGIKHLIDLWVYANANPGLDWSHIENELKKMNLHKFYLNVKKTISAWFECKCETEITDLITNVIFNSGQYGSMDMAIVNRSLRNGDDSALKIKCKRILSTVFLPYSVMKVKYEVLKKAPILLPFAWVIRCFDVLFNQKNHLNRYMKRMNQINSKQVNENKLALHVVGLDFTCEK